MEKTELFGYVVYANGEIYRNGEKVNYQKNIRVMWRNKFSRFVSYARFVYYAFHQNFDFSNHSFCIKHKDGNIENNAIDNLYATDKKEYLRGEKHKMSKLTDRQIAEIKYLYKYGQDKAQDLNAPIKKVSYRKLAKIYGVNHNVIRRIVKEDEEK